MWRGRRSRPSSAIDLLLRNVRWSTTTLVYVTRSSSDLELFVKHIIIRKFHFSYTWHSPSSSTFFFVLRSGASSTISSSSVVYYYLSNPFYFYILLLRNSSPNYTRAIQRIEQPEIKWFSSCVVLCSAQDKVQWLSTLEYCGWWWTQQPVMGGSIGYPHLSLSRSVSLQFSSTSSVTIMYKNNIISPHHPPEDHLIHRQQSLLCAKRQNAITVIMQADFSLALNVLWARSYMGNVFAVRRLHIYLVNIIYNILLWC